MGRNEITSRDADFGAGIDIHVVAPTSASAKVAMRAYIEDVATRYYRRPATALEVDAALSQHPADDLVAPQGVFLVALDGDDVVRGCVALARVSSDIGEVRRLHVSPIARGRGLGRRLMLEIEQQARAMGLRQLRLDTRQDLIESQRLYSSLGYIESPPHSGGPFSDRWYRKPLV